MSCSQSLKSARAREGSPAPQCPGPPPNLSHPPQAGGRRAGLGALHGLAPKGLVSAGRVLPVFLTILPPSLEYPEALWAARQLVWTQAKAKIFLVSVLSLPLLLFLLSCSFGFGLELEPSLPARWTAPRELNDAHQSRIGGLVSLVPHQMFMRIPGLQVLMRRGLGSWVFSS